jgi:hypothetical protein
VLLQIDSIAAADRFPNAVEAVARGAHRFREQSAARALSIVGHIKPFYLHGDFDGDGQQDTVILLKERATGKNGIAIYHGKANRLVIIGTGRDWGDGGDDFPGLNARYVFQRAGGGGRHGKKPPKLRGDALMVNQTDSASALIYWDGKRYGWYQQGD